MKNLKRLLVSSIQCVDCSTPDAMQVKGAAKTPPGREHLSRAHYYPNSVSNNYMRIEEVMPTAIGEECPILGMENFKFLPTVLVNIPTSRTRKFAMNEENLGIHILYNKKWNEG